MEGTTRRVAVFFGAGVLLAALVGFTVWATSSPGQHNRAGFTAEAAGTTEPSATETTSSPTTATVTESETRTHTVRSSARNAGATGNLGAAQAEPGPNRAGAAMPSAYNAESDPYLPPHAVVAPAEGQAQSSRVYRPSNIVPTAAPKAAQQGNRQVEEPKGAQNPTTARSTSQPTPGSTPAKEPQNSETAQPSSAVTPTPGGSAAQPSESVEPAHTPAPEPSKREESSQQEDGSANEPGSTEQSSQPEPAGEIPAEQPQANAAAQSAPQGPEAAAAEPSQAPPASQAPDAAPAGPTRVAGKEDVAGYPQENGGITPRDVFDKLTGIRPQ